MMRRLLLEPLVHFLVLGALLFLAYDWLNRDRTRAPDEIVVTRSQVDRLAAQFERVWQRPPTAQERQALVESWVRDEVFYREALALGLERDDPVVRRRLGQKVQFILDSGAPAAPSDAELQRWLDEHAEDYRFEPGYAMRQVYFDPSRHGAATQEVIEAARAALNAGRAFAGDPTLLPATMEGSASEIKHRLGDGFGEALRTLPVGSWQGPVRSSYGLHLVRIEKRTPERAARLEEVRAAVERDFGAARAQAAQEGAYRRLREKYLVRIEPGDAGI